MLSYCAMLAAGEYLVADLPNYASVWPCFLLLAGLIALFGHGYRLPLWPQAFFFFLGIAVCLHAALPAAQLYRERPWLRERPRAAARALRPRTGNPAPALRADISRRIGLGLMPADDAADLSRAILLGERRQLSPRTKRLFIESGTMHVFAISGLHVMAVSEVLTYLLLFLFVPLRLTGLFAVPLLWVYVWLIGSPPSAIRAAVMASLLNLSPIFWRQASGLRSWALAFLLIHLLRPLLIVDVGNALSFAVMLAIVIAGDFCRDCPKLLRSLVVTFAAWAVGVPISAHVFGRVTPGGLLANLVLVGAAKATVFAGVIGLAASAVSEWTAAHFNNLSNLMVKAMVVVADGVARVPWANFETGTWPLAACALWYVGLLLLLGIVFWCRLRRRMI